MVKINWTVASMTAGLTVALISGFTIIELAAQPERWRNNVLGFYAIVASVISIILVLLVVIPLWLRKRQKEEYADESETSPAESFFTICRISAIMQ